MTVTLSVRQSSLLRQQAVRARERPAPSVYRPLGVRPVSLADVRVAAALFPPPRAHGQIRGGDALQARHDGHGLGYAEGRTFDLVLGPGAVQLRVRDMARVDRALTRAIDDTDDVAFVAQQAGRIRVQPLPGMAHERATTITAWSRKSRARMARTISQLDLTGWQGADPLGMVTLTYPGDWLAVVPRGDVAKRHLSALRKRWGRAYGRVMRAVWKLEFQRRGAPHFHLLTRVPALAPWGWAPPGVEPSERVYSFEAWLSHTWADIVGATGDERVRHLAAGTGVDFAARVTDPKRIAVYFGKHGSKTSDGKEYQHNVPPTWRLPGCGPGRFWGVWGLDKALAVVEVDLPDFMALRRVLRRAVRANARRRGVTIRTFGAGGRMTGGFLLANDGAALASQLARWVVVSRKRAAGRDVLPDRHPWP